MDVSKFDPLATPLISREVRMFKSQNSQNSIFKNLIVIGFSMSLLSLTACQNKSKEGSTVYSPGSQPPSQKVGEPTSPLDGKNNRIRKEDVFVNVTCSSKKFSSLSDVDKEECYKKISERCQNIDVNSGDIETVPNWRPLFPPAQYMGYVYNHHYSEGSVKNHFTCALYSYLQEQNFKIKIQRDVLKKLREKQDRHEAWSFSDQMSLKSIIHQYSMWVDQNGIFSFPKKGVSFTPTSENPSEEFWNELLQRVQIIPMGLLLSISANESGWMHRSRFASVANNIWGRHAKPDCIVGKECVAAGKSNVFMKLYYNLEESVKDQFNYLNSHWNYKKFRRMRARDMKRDHLSSWSWAEGLDDYSGRSRGEYTRLLRELMSEKTNWVKYDDMKY